MMRLDYILYAIAIVLFIITLAAAVYVVQPQLWIVTTAVIGLAFIGLGYTQRPKPTAALATPNVSPAPTAPPQEQQQQPQQQPETTSVSTMPPHPEATMIEEPKPLAQLPQPPSSADLTEVKGIGEKRAAQLKALGVNRIEDLAGASAEDLAAKLNISPKITKKWIENAKEIGQKI
jgi:predicted flap endonuclease-1-like 5' DNA nuclease